MLRTKVRNYLAWYFWDLDWSINMLPWHTSQIRSHTYIADSYWQRNASTRRLLPATMLERWPHLCRVKIMFRFLSINWFVSTIFFGEMHREVDSRESESAFVREMSNPTLSCVVTTKGKKETRKSPPRPGQSLRQSLGSSRQTLSRHSEGFQRLTCSFLSFLSWVAKTHLKYWTKQVVRIQLIT